MLGYAGVVKPDVGLIAPADQAWHVSQWKRSAPMSALKYAKFMHDVSRMLESISVSRPTRNAGSIRRHRPERAAGHRSAPTHFANQRIAHMPFVTCTAHRGARRASLGERRSPSEQLVQQIFQRMVRPTPAGDAG